MAVTYTQIATASPSGVSSVNLSGISTAYNDLRLVITGSFTATNETVLLGYNSDTSAIYSRNFGRGNMSAFTALTTTGQSGVVLSAGGVAQSMPCQYTVDIMNYSSSSNFKSALILSNESNLGILTGYVSYGVGLWRSNSQITSVQIRLINGNFQTGSSIGLWGITNA